MCITENTKKLEILNYYNYFFYMYKINSKIFIETIKHDRGYFVGERFAVMLNISEILPIIYNDKNTYTDPNKFIIDFDSIEITIY